MMGGLSGRVLMLMVIIGVGNCYDYNDALSKSILFFEGQRSGKLPSSQRLRWRKDSALSDGFQIGVDLVGGYYDAGDNVKFNFPMAFTTTMLAWSVIEFGGNMGPEKQNALSAIKWATDYLLKSTSVPGFVYVQVGDPISDHSCWQRPEDMTTLRTPFAASKNFPASEVSAEIAAALASSAIAFRPSDRVYSSKLLSRAKTVFKFADTYRGSYNDTLGPWVCPFYCNYSGYEDELIWAAAWLYKATRMSSYLNYVVNNLQNLRKILVNDVNGILRSHGHFTEFGWDDKSAGINVLLSRTLNSSVATSLNQYISDADRFVCSVLPESPTVSVSYSPGGLMFKQGGSNLQHATALSFLMLTYSRVLNRDNRVIHCGNVVVTSGRLVQFARTQVDYILGKNPLNMSYMVGFGGKFPRKIHHRGSSLPSLDSHPGPIGCQGGSSYFNSYNPNPNLLTGAVVGGPDSEDSYGDSRSDFVHSEPTTYINAPLVGLLGYFRTRP